MGIFSRKKARADALEQLLSEIQLYGEVAPEDMLERLASLLDTSARLPDVLEGEIPEGLRAQGQKVLNELGKNWPGLEERLRPCAACGSPDFLVIELYIKEVVHAERGIVTSPRLYVAFCGYCGRAELFGKSLIEVANFSSRPRRITAKAVGNSSPFR